jgi:hypothetical protein
MARNNRLKRLKHKKKRKQAARCSRRKHRNIQRSKKRQNKIDKASAFITNISDYGLTDDQIIALSKGLGFIPTPDKPSRNTIIRDCNNLIRTMRIRYHAAQNIWPKRHRFRLKSEWHPGPTTSNALEDFFESLKVELSKLPFSKVKPNYTPNEKKAWEELSKDRNIVLKPYDKGRGIAVISKAHYLEEGYRQLGMKDQYLKLDYDPTNHTAETLHNLVCEMHLNKQIDQSLADYLDPYNGQTRTPVFFMLPKIHKTPPEGVRFVGRPVVSNCSSPLERASELIDFYLLPVVKSQPTYLKDTGDTIRKIESIHLPQNVILASFDVVSMFTSVPQDQAFQITLETLANLDPFDYDPIMPDIEYMTELLRLVLYRNSFEFNDEHFLQTSGVPMGQKSSGSICNLVIHDLENKILGATAHIHTLYRYMDDTLVFWTGSLEQLEAFVQHINTLHASLKFSYEASEHSVQFLDLVVYKGKRFEETGVPDIKCHTKKTETGQFLHRSSCHPQPVFDGFLRGEIIRYAKNNSYFKTFEEKKDFFMKKLSARGYDDAELLKASSSINFEDRQLYIQERHKSPQIPLVFKTKYNPHFAGKDMKRAILKHWNIITNNERLGMIFPKPPMIAYSRSENLRDSLVKAKLPPRKEGDHTYGDLVMDEEVLPSSPTLQDLKDLEFESRGFNLCVLFSDSEEEPFGTQDNISPPQNGETT